MGRSWARHWFHKILGTPKNGDPGPHYPGYMGTPLGKWCCTFGFTDNNLATSGMRDQRRSFTVQWWHLESVSWYSCGTYRVLHATVAVCQERHTALSLTVIDKMDRLGEVIPIHIEAVSPIDRT